MVKFNLKPDNKKGLSLILLIFNFNNQRLKISTKKYVNPKFWNPNTQRVRDSYEIVNGSKINETLDDFESKLKLAYNDLINKNIIPTKINLKEKLLKSLSSPISTEHTIAFWQLYNEFVEYKKTRVKDVRDFQNSLRKHLENTEELYGESLHFELFKNGSSFIDRMTEYLTYEAINADGSEGLRINTIGKQFKNLKVFLNWCFDRELTVPFSLKHIVTKTEEVENIYLTKDDLNALENLKLDKEDEKIRDTFLIGCKTGLRFSDYTCISKDQFRDGNLHVNPQKTELTSTNNKVIIPIGKSLDVLLSKYNYASPKIKNLTITEFNKKLRKLGDLANIHTPITISKNVSGKIQKVTSTKNELISSHTCRRTFCTLMFLDGMPPAAIMKFSGHKTERSFMRYLKLDSELAAITYKDYFD